MKKVSKIVGLIVAVSMLFCGCGISRGARNLKPDDDLSRAVHDAMADDFYYVGKEEGIDGVIIYEYEIKRKEGNAVTEFVNAINDYLIAEQEKIMVIVFIEVPGGLSSIFNLKNFSDSKLEKADYDGLYSLYIREAFDGPYEFFHDPSIYTGIEGIRKLNIGEEMQQKAEEEGIDWYAYWPDLEEVIVREADDD